MQNEIAEPSGSPNRAIALWFVLGASCARSLAFSIAMNQASLQKNTRLNLIRTLEDWSDRERQVNYKQAVPFVHVPEELLAQWGQYAHLLKQGQDWFIRSLDERELAAMSAFDTVVAAFSCDGQLPDVPEVFELPQWLGLMDRARNLLAVLKSRSMKCEPGGAGSRHRSGQ